MLLYLLADIMSEILIIATTNRTNSKTYQFAEYYRQLLLEQHGHTDILNLADLPTDFAFSALYENSGKNPVFNTQKALMDAAEKFVFIVPEYNGSFPGVLKTFIDGLGWPNSLAGKKAALVGISDGNLGGAHALSHLTDILHYLGCNVLSRLVRVPVMKKNFAEGKLQDDFVTQLVALQVKELLDF